MRPRTSSTAESEISKHPQHGKALAGRIQLTAKALLCCVGIVQRIETLATDHKLVVAFDSVGEKTLLAKFAKLTKL